MIDDFDFDSVGKAGMGRGVRDAYEDAAVRFACRAIGLPDLPREIDADVRARTGKGGCNFAMFDELAGFPVCLRVGKLRHVRFLSLPDLFNNFARTPIGRALAEMADEYDSDDRPLGLVFRWAGAKDDRGRQRTIKGGKFMVAHTAPCGDRTTVRIIAGMKLGGDDRAVTVETLSAFLADYCLHGD